MSSGNPAMPPATSTAASSAAARAARTQAVLLVDDEGDIVESLKELIERGLPTVKVHTASSGPEALEALRSRRMDLVITDYKMPGMNGLEFLRAAERITPGVPRILITAFPDLQVAIQAINETAIDRFYTKPFDGHEIVEAIRGVLGDHRTREAWNHNFMESLSVLKKRNSLDD